MTGDPLVNELAARMIGSGSARIQPQLHSSLERDRRSAIDKALAMLPENVRDTMPNITLDEHVEPFGWYNRETNAKINRDDAHGGITVMGNASNYRSASKGDANALMKLASILVHEKYHLDHEPGEGPAYDAQLETLRNLRAPKSMIREVLNARDVATGR